MKKCLFLLPLILCFVLSGAAQQLYIFDRGKSKAEIPFEYKNNFILVKVWLNKFIPLNFIFDTGAEYTILAKREYTDLLGVEYGKEFSLIGADLSIELKAHLAKSIDIKLNGMSAPKRNILVLEDNYFKFEEYTGLVIDGILGADLFRHFVVKIDYKRQVLTFYNPQNFELKSGYTPFSITTDDGKVFLKTTIDFQDSLKIDANLLVDSGAGLSLLLHTNTHPDFKLPTTTITGNIGLGLGGFMEGYLGRIKSLQLPPFGFNNLITNFQELPPRVDSISITNRDGIIGNGLLSRFEVIIDYLNHTLHLKPRKNYNRGFKYDRSGLVLLAGGDSFDKIEIRNVVPDTPAAEAGLLPGDEIVNINFIPVSLTSLPAINRKLQGKIGKKIRLAIKRDGKKLIKKFTLRDII